MSIAIESPPLETFAELLEKLGDISPERILIHPPPGTATEDDVIVALEGPRKRICELIDGVLVEKAMGYAESVLASLLIEWMNAWIRPRNLGLVSSPDGTVRLWPGRVRIPDIAFVSWDRFPNRKRSPQPIPTLVPNLAVEILSVSNTKREMRLKREDYFRMGVGVAWEIDPEARTVTVYTAVEKPDAILTEADTLTVESILPGFSISLRDFFAELDRHG